ncbi:MAG: hypothetical protein AAGA32_21130 [Pseudomonadota bacterium]
MSVVPPGSPPFALAPAGAREAAQSATGFDEVTVSETPADGFPDAFRDFSVRGVKILERQTPDILARIETTWTEGFAPHADTSRIRVPMPALIASGRKS